MNRTREQFVSLWEHEVAGIVLDAATAGRSGAELSVWLRMAMNKIRDRLGRAYDDLTKDDKPLPAKVPVNGAQQPQTQVRK